MASTTDKAQSLSTKLKDGLGDFFWMLPGRVFRSLLIFYIALIGIFAIEELQRREKLLGMIAARELESAAALVRLPDARDEHTTEQRALLEKEHAALQALRERTSALIVVGAVGPNGTLKEISCELTALRDPATACPGPPRSRGREIAATVVLKRPAEERSSGDIFAVLVLVAAMGGALIRLYLPNESEKESFRSVLRAVGGGVVCYLALSGGSLPLTGQNVTANTSPATGALLGLFSGMFATKVFAVAAEVVDAFVKRLLPPKQAEPSPPPPPPTT